MCNRLTTVQDIQDYASHVFWTQCNIACHSGPAVVYIGLGASIHTLGKDVQESWKTLMSLRV